MPSPTGGDVPQEHHMHLLGRYYRQVEAGRKTIEVRVATPNKRTVVAGDTVVFHDRDTGRELDVTVQQITSYPSFKELLGSEDPERIDPDGPPGELLAALRSIYPPSTRSRKRSSSPIPPPRRQAHARPVTTLLACSGRRSPHTPMITR
ncbi:ASCH domain-containing protein [Streptomyces rubrogriseus]|uniref:ASCH domain-containing protein n=1 Tax=Streptomyces rubrogriseus TaxID=194673 RepID=UPI001EF36ACC|nr:ASCH domain-containing protein [Streptomyces rubrogriseus]